jgi:hypothetical protein
LVLAVVACSPAVAGDYSPEEDFLARINRVRDRAGVTALTADRHLAGIAAQWARSMAAAGAISHNPDLSALLPDAKHVAENVGVGPTVALIQQGFERSPEQRANLLDPRLRRIGIGTFHDRGVLWVVQDFDEPRGAAVTGAAPRNAPEGQERASGKLHTDVRIVVFETTFEEFGPAGVARGWMSWGAGTFAPVESGSDGGRGQLVHVGAGATGGFWFEIPVKPGVTYIQAVDLEILRLEPGARIEMILEWFDAASELIGYRLVPVVHSGRAGVAPQQLADAPPHAATVRFVVNVAGGGSYVLDNARLEALAPASPAPRPSP